MTHSNRNSKKPSRVALLLRYELRRRRQRGRVRGDALHHGSRLHRAGADCLRGPALELLRVPSCQRRERQRRALSPRKQQECQGQELRRCRCERGHQRGARIEGSVLGVAFILFLSLARLVARVQQPDVACLLNEAWPASCLARARGPIEAARGELDELK